MGVDPAVLDRMSAKLAEYGITVTEPSQPYDEATYLQNQKARIFAIWPASYSAIVLEDKATGHDWTYAQRCHYPNWPAEPDCP